jgi:hypothetical protein
VLLSKSPKLTKGMNALSGKYGHFITQCPDNENDQVQEKKRKKEKKNNYKKEKAMLTLAMSGIRTALHPTPMMRDLLPQPSTSPPSPQLETHLPHG